MICRPALHSQPDLASRVQCTERVSFPPIGALIFFGGDNANLKSFSASDGVAQEPAEGAASLRKVTLVDAGELPALTEREHWAARVAFGIVLAAILVGFWTFARQFHAAAHGGADQNGYLVGGRMLAEHFSPGLKPGDPYAFVGRMWVAAPDGRYFPKYPAGLPVIVAVVYKLAGPAAAYFISPVAMTLALVAVFLIARLVVGSFGGALAALIVATSPVTLGLTNNPNSHAATLCFASWGFYLLLRWWQRGGYWRAALAGLLLGCAATIRYGEALFLLPVLLVAVFSLRLRVRRAWLGVAALLGGWVLPVVLLLASNRLTLGSWTGYGATGESTGFDWRYFAQNWDVVIRQLAGTGLFLTLPLGVLGLIQLFARNWRLATVFWAWVLPGVLLYGAYYWAPENMGIAYARFFLTVFPPLALGAAWCLTCMAPVPPHSAWSFRWIVGPLAALILVLGAGAYNVWAALPMLASDYRKASIIADAADRIVHDAKVPAGSAIFGPREVLHHLQFVGDYRLYAGEQFDRGFIAQLAAEPNQPGTLQPSRAAALRELLEGKTDAQLAGVLRGLAERHLNDGRRLFAVIPEGGVLPQRFGDREFDRQDGRAFDTRMLVTWSEPALPTRWGGRRERGFGASDGYRAGTEAPPLRWTLVEIVRASRPAPATTKMSRPTSAPSPDAKS